MKASLRLGSLLLLFGAAAAFMFLTDGSAAGDSPKAPNIVGTYKFVSRELSNGEKVVPPNIVGLISFTENHRNFNIYWKTPTGKDFSISAIREYTLTDKEYTEKNIYTAINNGDTGEGISYDLSDKSGGNPITMTESGFKIQLPLYDEPMVHFQGDKFTATLEGEFVDRWEKVD
ncbi:MAG: hypothetical protein O7H41_16480 [Planctomycetota bacterium]|nr:hypothetical protein [Planctomycetota bacterium]